MRRGQISSYIHNPVAGNLGKIGVLVALESDIDQQRLSPLGKKLAMHIAACRPKAVSREKLHQDDVDRERAI